MEDRYAGRWIISRYAIVSWYAGRIEITSSASGVTFQTDNPDILHLLNAFARSRTIGEVVGVRCGYPSEQVAACIDELIDAGILIKPTEEDLPALQHWERSTLAFHRKSRQPGFQSSPLHATAAVVAPESQRTIPLDRPSRGKDRGLSDVLESRCSWRAWPNRTIAFETFSNLLWMSARNRDAAPEAILRNHVSRPYPSGGAAYSLELYPVIAPGAVESIRAGVYRYLPELHGLEEISEEAAHYIPFLEAAGRSASSTRPPIVLVITSRFSRQSEAYGDLAYSLVLKEVGALFQTLYLVAEYLDLAACALGGGTPDELLAQLCSTAELVEPVVGEFVIGPR